ncbi:helix-turn-helix domain-containing protein [Halomonas sp. E14]|uniref:helix-turn-helix domain-containing protein n=1 Tax=Halomonas sp. E14 TaxID=3397245 RepID=UPI00403E68F5
MESLGNRIKRLRLQAKLNKAALARQVGVSDVTVSYWESGAIKQIGHERLLALAGALGCSLQALLDDAPRPATGILVLESTPPVPWLNLGAHSANLDQALPPGTHWQGEWYLVTPAPGVHFDYLERGDLAAFGATEAFEAPGHYLIEDDTLFIGRLEQSISGKLLCQRSGRLGDVPQPLGNQARVVGKLLARWRSTLA